MCSQCQVPVTSGAAAFRIECNRLISPSEMLKNRVTVVQTTGDELRVSTVKAETVLIYN